MPCLETDAYASHLPVLEALSKLLPMRRVLEFGAGRYSTPFFLERGEHLVSIEPDSEWREIVAESYGTALDAGEWELWPEVGLMSGHLSGFDLIFIDDGHAADDRAATIRWVLGQPHPPVLIHDAEVPKYQAAIRESGAYSFTFKWGEPWTALVWR